MVAAAAPRYEVVCRLASGGMADLYLARATGLAGFERLVVIKRLADQHKGNAAMVQALYDEARIAAVLSHANIVQVNDVEVVDGQVSIVMEFLHGQDASQLLERMRKARTRLPLDQAVAIALGVCAGLHHAHERVGSDGQPLQIVHRDVSPHNVFVTYDGAVKLVDFGIARAASRRGRTEVGVIKGKPGYISPETLRGKRVDRRTDVWGAGVLLYELTTGVTPYPEDANLDALVAVVTNDPPPPSTHVPDYPPELAAIVAKAMARDAGERYATCEDLRVELERFARARRLDLSPFRMMALMEKLFSGQINAWRAAQKQGLSLAQHVIASRASRAMDAIDPNDSMLPRLAQSLPGGAFEVMRASAADFAEAPTEHDEATVFDTSVHWSIGAALSHVIDVPAEAIAELEAEQPSVTMKGVGGRPVVTRPPSPMAEPPLTSTIAAPKRSRWPAIVASVVAAPIIVIAGLAAWGAIGGTKPSRATPSPTPTPEVREAAIDAAEVGPPQPTPVPAPVEEPQLAHEDGALRATITIPKAVVADPVPVRRTTPGPSTGPQRPPKPKYDPNDDNSPLP